MSELECQGCRRTGVRLDLDVKASPPEHVCLKCLPRPKCDRCSRRVSRVALQVPERRLPTGEPIFFQGWKRLCLRCNA